MLATWEIPLVVMDATLFYYRKLNTTDALVKMEELISEVKRFNGVFSLLWHNGYFDEKITPGIRRFYEKLLERIHEDQPESMTGSEIIDRITQSNH